MTAADIQAIVDETILLAQTAGKTVEALDPQVAVPTEVALQLVTIFGQLIGKGIAGWEGAANTNINPETIAALAADRTPLANPEDDPLPAGTGDKSGSAEPIAQPQTKTGWPTPSPSNPAPGTGSGTPEDPEPDQGNPS